MARHRKSASSRGKPPLTATQRALGSLKLRQRQLTARQATLQRRVWREARKSARLALRKARSEGRPMLRILCEGDSWMHYDCGIGVMSNIEWQLGSRAACLNLASSGDTMVNMMKPPQRRELDRELRSGIDGAPWDALVFSCGGNDVAGDEFVEWLLPYAGQKDPRDAIAQPRFTALLQKLAALYGDLATRVHGYSPGTVVLLNEYDFAIPDGRGVPFAGPWLAPGFTARGYDATTLAFRSSVVRLLLEQFAAMLEDLHRVYPFMQPMHTQGLLQPRDWANELHPTNSGFRRIAGVFLEALRQIEQRPARRHM